MDGKVDNALRFALDGLLTRQKVTAANVANVDTPGYKASDVNFETNLRRAISRARSADELDRTSAQHFSTAGRTDDVSDPVEIVTNDETTMRNDGNNVDIDREMVKLAETTIQYSAVSRLVAERYALMRTIISEGRR